MSLYIQSYLTDAAKVKKVFGCKNKLFFEKAMLKLRDELDDLDADYDEQINFDKNAKTVLLDIINGKIQFNDMAFMYVHIYEKLCSVFGEQVFPPNDEYSVPYFKAIGLKPSAFSFNVEGGRCDVCQGEGEVKIEMQFMADIYLPCEACNGKRFKQHVLDVTYKEKNVFEVLDMTIDEALEFFQSETKIAAKIKPLADVGLGYVHLGQSSNTLSGGEAQRIKLASFLVKGNNSSKTLFIFDEPTTGLHFHDIKKLLKSFDALIEQGNTIIVIEHNMDVIKCADWVIDIGPEGGDRGGNVVFEGVPEDLILEKGSYTGSFLKERFKG